MNVFSSLGTLISDIVCYPLGAVMKVFFIFSQNYALLLILFTIVIRLCLFPLAIKQQKSSAEMLRMKPKMDQLQKKYAKDKEKLQAEMSKLYSEEGYNPLSGCLPMVLQMPILFGLYQVVYNPLKYLMWFSQDTINKVASVLRPYIKSEFNVTNFNDPKIELYLAKSMSKHMDKLEFLGNVKNVNFNLFGIDMSAVPKLGFTVFMLIPILVYVSQALSSWLSFRMNKQIQQGQMGGMNSMFMVLLMPVMSVWFSFAMPAAVGFYWIISNLLMIVQVLVLQRYYSLERLAAKSQVEAEKRRQGIIDGTIKPSRISQMAQRAMEAQKQQSSGVQRGDVTQTQGREVSAENPVERVKVNSKGKKSRSQIKDEQRNRLAKSRNNSLK